MERDELHSILEMKLTDCWNTYVDGLRDLSLDEIIENAGEIAATRFCYDELTKTLAAKPDYLLEHLLGYDDPLAATRERWLEEQYGDHCGGLEYTILSLWDDGPHSGDSSMDSTN